MCDPTSDEDTPLSERIAALVEAGRISEVAELVRDLERRTEVERERAEAERERAQAAVDEADELGEKVRKLDYLNKYLTRLLYGRRSEKLSREELRQLSLALDGDGSEQTPTPDPDASACAEPPEGERPKGPRKPKKRRPNHPGRTPLSPELERVIDAEVRVPDDERVCSHCGESMCTFDWVEHERVEYVPAHFVVHVERREKVACKNKACQGEAATADRDKEPKLPTRVGASVLAHMLESKCDDAMPVYRLRDRFARLGFDVPLNTMYGYWTFALDLLVPVAEVTLGVVLDEDVVCIDDTGMPVLDKTKPKGKFRGHLWAFKGNTSKMVAFQFTETWAASEVQPWIAAIKGYIQVDDYKGYSALVASLADPDQMVKLVADEVRLGCMMHVRRRFYDAYKLADARAGPGLEYIRKLYEVEAEARKLGLDADGRLTLRNEKSLPVLEQLYAWIDDLVPKVGKTSKLAEAVRYARNQRVYIERCFSDGRFEIDNGEIERVLKKPCIGRRNFLHCGSAKGAKRLCAAYTLVLSAKALGLDVQAYLTDVINKLAAGWPLRQIRQLVPDAWAAARAAEQASE